jgi:hypothetical protein
VNALVPPPAAVLPIDVAKLVALAQRLREEGRVEDALTLYEHVATLYPREPLAVRDHVNALAARGRLLEAIDRLCDLQALVGGPAAIAAEIRTHSTAAIARFNALVAANRLDEAEKYAAGLTRLLPGAVGMLEAALSCNQALGRAEAAQGYARALLAVQPDHAAAQAALAAAAGGIEAEIDAKVAQALAPAAGTHPLIQLRDIHDAASMIFCRPLTEASLAQLKTLIDAGLSLTVEAEPGSEWEGWARHYRVLIEAFDAAAVAAPTPRAGPEPDLAFMTAKGRALDWKGLQAHARKLGAQVVFFAAADARYVELYARWYALSVLKYADVPALVVIHVVGGAETLSDAVKTVGIQDDRLAYTGCLFDPGSVSTRAFDAPPKGEADRPIAHFQCVRFQRLGELLKRLKRPVFVSDIDLLLQRGVADLLERCADADVVFNENEGNWNAGSRLTANLMLVRPTANAQLLLRFLRAYLDDKLSGAEVTRWIDQVGLVHARHHLMQHGSDPKIAYFDTSSDINNVMYPSYQANPFRFLSLFHGFDTSSLEDAAVLG